MEKNILIKDLLSDGRGVGVLTDDSTEKKVFVDGLLPDEEALVQILNEKKNYFEATVLKIKKFSSKRIEPFCSHYAECGGCQLQHYDYEEENKYKKNKIIQSLKKIAHIENISNINFNFLKEKNYRTRIRLQIKLINNKYVIGFYKKNSNDIVDINNCSIFVEDISLILKDIKSLLEKEPLKKDVYKEISFFYSHKQDKIYISFHIYKYIANLSEIAHDLAKKYSNIGGIYSTKENSNYFNTLTGDKYIIETLLDFDVNYYPLSFFQNNHQISILIYQKITSFVKKEDSILELYSGVGCISIILSSMVKKLSAVEVNKNSHQLAIINIENNQINNITAYERDVSHFKIEDNFNVLIVNPPRIGLSKKLINQIKTIKFKTIIYMSCNENTFSRDINNIKDIYHIEFIEGYNMFPKTQHLEILSVLSLN